MGLWGSKSEEPAAPPPVIQVQIGFSQTRVFLCQLVVTNISGAPLYVLGKPEHVQLRLMVDDAPTVLSDPKASVPSADSVITVAPNQRIIISIDVLTFVRRLYAEKDSFAVVDKHYVLPEGVPSSLVLSGVVQYSTQPDVYDRAQWKSGTSNPQVWQLPRNYLLSKDAAATRIQAIVRGFLLRRTSPVPALLQLARFRADARGLAEPWRAGLDEGTLTYKEAKGLEQNLLLILLKVDSVQTNGSQIVKTKRKETVVAIQTEVERAEAHLAKLAARPN